MKLGYYLEKTDEEGTFKYVPAWILTQYEDMTDSTNETYPTQMVVLDATDGTVIDLMELSKHLAHIRVMKQIRSQEMYLMTAVHRYLL